MSKSHISRVRELYKIILRMHRSLPDDLKILGDNYAREEFKRHKKCKPQEAQIFLNEWREYAVSMSRQMAPARAERRLLANDQQGGPFRRVRPADQWQAAAEGGAVRAADQWQAATEGGKVRAADQGQAAAGGGEVRAVDQGQAIGAAAGAHHRFGNDLDEENIDQLNPDQLLNLYNLLMAARGENPQGEYANEPIDAGIDLIEADVYAKRVQDAEDHMIKLKIKEIKQLIRGEIQEQDIFYSKSFWYVLLDDSQTVKDIDKYKIAARSARILIKEAKKAKHSADKAAKKSVKAKNIADSALAIAENAKNSAAAVESTVGNDHKLHDTVIITQKRALKKAIKAKKIQEQAIKLLVEAKEKEEEAIAAFDFTEELKKDIKEDMKKYD